MFMLDAPIFLAGSLAYATLAGPELAQRAQMWTNAPARFTTATCMRHVLIPLDHLGARAMPDGLVLV